MLPGHLLQGLNRVCGCGNVPRRVVTYPVVIHLGPVEVSPPPPNPVVHPDDAGQELLSRLKECCLAPNCCLMVAFVSLQVSAVCKFPLLGGLLRAELFVLQRLLMLKLAGLRRTLPLLSDPVVKKLEPLVREARGSARCHRESEELLPSQVHAREPILPRSTGKWCGTRGQQLTATAVITGLNLARIGLVEGGYARPDLPRLWMRRGVPEQPARGRWRCVPYPD
jgi:hypothetical protein